jgi:hypothetical protein
MQDVGLEAGTVLPGTGQVRREGPLGLLPTVGTGFDLGLDVADDLLEDDIDAGAPLAVLGGEVRRSSPPWSPWVTGMRVTVSTVRVWSLRVWSLRVWSLRVWSLRVWRADRPLALAPAGASASSVLSVRDDGLRWSNGSGHLS